MAYCKLSGSLTIEVADFKNLMGAWRTGGHLVSRYIVIAVLTEALKRRLPKALRARVV